MIMKALKDAKQSGTEGAAMPHCGPHSVLHSCLAGCTIYYTSTLGLPVEVGSARLHGFAYIEGRVRDIWQGGYHLQSVWASCVSKADTDLPLRHVKQAFSICYPTQNLLNQWQCHEQRLSYYQVAVAMCVTYIFHFISQLLEQSVHVLKAVHAHAINYFVNLRLVHALS